MSMLSGSGSSMLLRDSSIFVLSCVILVAALGPIEFGYTSGYSTPIEAEIISDLRITSNKERGMASHPPLIYLKTNRKASCYSNQCKQAVFEKSAPNFRQSHVRVFMSFKDPRSAA